MKYENLTLEIKKYVEAYQCIASVYHLVISAEELVTRNFLKYLENVG
jgi:hypothetical protein